MKMALNISDPQSLVNHINNSLNSSIDLNNSSNSSSNINAAGSSTNGKKKRSYDFQNRKIRRRIWQEDEVHKLIMVWSTRLDDLRQSKKNRHIYEEISDELNRMGLDTIREEVHIKIQNLSQLYRNEKRRIEGTGEAPAWQYYHEVDELLGAHNDQSMDLSNLDESNIMNSTSIKDEVVSIGDSCSDNDTDENRHSSGESQHAKNGYDHSTKKLKMEFGHDTPLQIRSPVMPFNAIANNKMTSINKPQATSSNLYERKSLSSSQTTANNNSSLDALLQAIESASAISDANLTPNNIQLEILKEIRKANALAEVERREAKKMHQEMKELEEHRFKLTQMYVERSLALQKQTLDSIRLLNRSSGSGGKSSINGNGSGAGGGGGGGLDNSFKFSPRQQSSRPQFILTKKKKSNAQSSKHDNNTSS